MITVEHLTKCYGDHLAVDDLSFEIEEGHVYGFLGPNGAGKSTTMNIMTGCLSATEGRVLIDGHDIFEEPKAAKRAIGYLPEIPPLYMNESPLTYLSFVGRAKGLKGTELKKQIEEVVLETGIDDVKTRRISALSKGYKQRVGIAQALLGNPKVIILDEPTVGLDPLQIVEIRELIRKLGEKHTVIFSSHILSEVQTICDRILMIAHGRLVVFDETDKLESHLKLKGQIMIDTDMSFDEARKALNGVEDILEISSVPGDAEGTKVLVSTSCEDLRAFSGKIFDAFSKNGGVIYELNPKKANLEEIFIGLAEGDVQTASDEPGEAIQ